MIMCNNCEEFFDLDDADFGYEPHGEKTPLCPCCGSDDLKYIDEYFNALDEMEEDDEE